MIKTLAGAIAIGLGSSLALADAADREVPIPTAVSSELEAAIRDWPVRQVADMPPPPADAEGWRQLISATDTQRAAAMASVLEETGVTLEEDSMAGVRVYRLAPATVAAKHEGRVFLYLHGGAYVYGNGLAGVFEAILIAARVQIPVTSVDYRMPPDHPFPAAVDDAVAVYEALSEALSAGSIALGGTSAGGGLALATVHRLLASGQTPPGAIYAGTPWADLSKTGDTLFTNEVLDRVLVTYDAGLGAAAELYAGEMDLKDPLLSPVYGDFSGFPPTILTTGTRDLFLSDVARTHRKLRAAGIESDLHVYEGMSHAGYLVSPDIPESIDMYREIDRFIDLHLE
ncbi:MAG: alpha/beta hydrolase [Pseudomonadota bacterium]